MNAASRGDPHAATELWRRFTGRVFGIGLRTLGDPPSAQDLVQETLLQVWLNAERFDPSRGNLDVWVLTIARRKAISMLRRRATEARCAPRLLWAVPMVEPGPEELVESADMAERLRREVGRLPPPQRVAIELSFLRGLSRAEAAAIERIPVGTLKSRVRSGVDKLRDAMGERAAAG